MEEMAAAFRMLPNIFLGDWAGIARHFRHAMLRCMPALVFCREGWDRRRKHLPDDGQSVVHLPH